MGEPFLAPGAAIGYSFAMWNFSKAGRWQMRKYPLRVRGGWAGLAFSLLLAHVALAQLSESFEYGVPPPGWTKTNLLGGSGWYQLPVGVMPLPGWGNGTSSVPAVANAGTHNAYCSWTTGGGAADAGAPDVTSRAIVNSTRTITRGTGDLHRD